MGVAILIKSVEVENNVRNESYEVICDERVRGANRGPEKGAHNDVFLIES